MFGDVLYIRIYPNKIVIRDVKRDVEISRQSTSPFSSNRLLVGNFTAADELLRGLIAEIAPKKLLKLPHKAVIHPKEMVEGGLSQVEERLFIELARGTGASKVAIHLGVDLSRDGVLACLN